MTAGLIKVMPSEIVLVADTLCLDGATGSAIAGAEKLFIHGGKAAIFSWGRGPDDVRKKVRGLDPSEVRPEALARALRESFREVSAPYFFGLYIAGFDGAKPSLWHVDVPTSDAGTQDRSSIPGPHTVSPLGTHETLNAWLAAHQSTDPVILGVGFVQQAHALAPSDVGADAKRIRVTARGADWV
jgi:hypothetical protein